MTPTEINTELERFKDRVNSDGKATLDRLKDALAPYLTPTEKDVVIEKQKDVASTGDRRIDLRDPMEMEQHQAEKLGITPKPKSKLKH